MSSPVPGMGAVPHEDGTTFRVWAPHADAVSVVGDFNDWSDAAHPLAHEADGFWAVDVAEARPGAQYKFRLRNGDDVLDRVDPQARAVTNSVGNGIVYDRSSFDWQGDSFTCPPHGELVVYETHIGSFAGTGDQPGDIAGLGAKLDYLRDLGVNAIELMPVAEFAGDYSWGYNPAHLFAVESGYGGPDLLKLFVREAHQHGIAVILDVVYNHFGPSDLPTWQFDGWSENDKGGIYFYQDWRSATPWGDTRPDYGRPEVRQFIHDNVAMWIEEFHVDGLRFDSTVNIRRTDWDGEDIPEGWELMRWLNAQVRERYPDKLLVAEDLQGDPALVAPPDEGGAGFHAQWSTGFVHAVREELARPDDGARSVTRVAEAIVMDGDPFSRVVYTESHDEVANGRVRVVTEIDPEDASGWAAQKRATLGAAIALTSPGIPMLFQGQEFLEDEWFRDDVPLDWERAEAFRDVVRLFRDLVHLRRGYDGVARGLSGSQTRIAHLDESAKTLAWVRSTDDGQHALVVANLAGDPRDVRASVPVGGRWSVRFNSDARTYSALFGDHPSSDAEAEAGSNPGDGDDNSNDNDNGTGSGDGAHSVPVSVGPYSLVVLTPAG